MSARKRLRKTLVRVRRPAAVHRPCQRHRPQAHTAGAGLVPARWVFVRDQRGTHRDAYCFTTDPTLGFEQVVSWYTQCERIDAAYQEPHAPLGFATTWPRVAALRLGTGPCLLGLFSVSRGVSAAPLRDLRPPPQPLSGYAKQEPTFADALATVRRLFWEETRFASSAGQAGSAKLPADLTESLLNCLCPAA